MPAPLVAWPPKEVKGGPIPTSTDPEGLSLPEEPLPIMSSQCLHFFQSTTVLSTSYQTHAYRGLL